jgi:hypothetical protein
LPGFQPILLWYNLIKYPEVMWIHISMNFANVYSHQPLTQSNLDCFYHLKKFPFGILHATSISPNLKMYCFLITLDQFVKDRILCTWNCKMWIYCFWLLWHSIMFYSFICGIELISFVIIITSKWPYNLWYTTIRFPIHYLW